jgi:hypothetical protein
MQNSPITGTPVFIHNPLATNQETQVPESKQAVKVAAEPLPPSATSSISNQTSLISRSVAATETTTSSKLDRKSLPLTSQDFENSHVDNSTKIGDFVRVFDIENILGGSSPDSYLKKESIDLNDPLFYESFSKDNFSKLSLPFIKILVEHGLNLDTENYISLMNERIVLLNHVNNDSFNETLHMALLTRAPVLTIPFNQQNKDNAKLFDENIRFFASQTSTDQIKESINASETGLGTESALKSFDAGKIERYDRTHGLHAQLTETFPAVISTIITDYLNESPDKDSKRPPDPPAEPDPANCCVIS